VFTVACLPVWLPVIPQQRSNGRIGDEHNIPAPATTSTIWSASRLALPFLEGSHTRTASTAAGEQPNRVNKGSHR
jgi:hypothetical protein